MEFRLIHLLGVLLAGGCSPDWKQGDADGDGFTWADGDCWDAPEGPPGSDLSGSDIYPGAAETWYDGVDQDCGWDSDYDADGDGYVPTAYADQAGDLQSGDCDDLEASVNPGAGDEWYDGVDQDCSGNDDYDQDGDGYVPDGYEGLPTAYVDGSGALPGGDCDDLFTEVNPGARDDWYDGVDSDCSGNDDYDQDGDGYVPLEFHGSETEYVPDSGNLPAGDCDDTDPYRFLDPDAEVVWYNGFDERCDENDGDQDGDGFWHEDYEALVTAAGGTPLVIPSGRDGDCFDDLAQRPDDGDTADPLVPINGGDLLDPEEIHPGALDDPYDAVDADCAGDSDFDKDGDGYDSECVEQRDGSYGDDCLDDDDSGACGDADLAGLGPLGVYPGAFDRWYDGTDADCENDDDFDADYDGYANRDYADGYGAYVDAYGVPALDTTDCDDDDPEMSPGVVDSWYDGVDTDCSGNDDFDQDHDGFVADAYVGRATEGVDGSGSLPGGDCDDADDGFNPAESDSWYDGVDSDCAGNDDFDRDADGYVPDAFVGHETDYGVSDGGGDLPGNDCDDTDDDVNPGEADVWYDGVDDNCSGNDDYDADGDGYVPDAYVGLETELVDGSGSLPGSDCDDGESDVNPGESDAWYDGIDQDCQGEDDYDADGDGYVPDAYVGRETEYVGGSGTLPGSDCDDTRATINPDAADAWYDGEDTDCSGNDDYDRDGDGYVRTVDTGKETTYVSGSGSLPGDDCDDTDYTINPAADETWYDGVDQDCDDWSDYDADYDGQDSDAYSGNDCDDTDDDVYYGAPEVWYDGVDQDCDDWSDYDADFDGQDHESYGGGDCDDTDADIYYGAPDTWYDGLDSDCAGDSDYDRDGDGDDSDSYGGGDCDDTDADFYSGAPDTWYDGLDSDCEGNDDYDRDGDEYAAEGYSGSSLPHTDCDDADPSTNPGATEVWYDGHDSDCDDADDYDRDGDGHAAEGYSASELPADDCDDGDAAVYAGAPDVWYDGVDSDCGGEDDYDADGDGDDSDLYGGGDCDDTDESVSSFEAEVWYDGIDSDCDASDDYDADGDGHAAEGYGSSSLPDDDCDDADPDRHPDLTDDADGVDQDCDGFIDEDSVEVGSLIFTEVMVNSADAGTEEWEWFELYNASDEHIYLDGWEFRENVGGGYSFWVSPEAAVSVAPGDYVVLCYGNETPGLDACDYVYGHNLWEDSSEGAAAESGYRLNNLGDGNLYVVVAGMTVDYVELWGFLDAGVYSNGASAELSLDHHDWSGNNYVENWCESTSVFTTTTAGEGYDGDHFGTPGSENDCTGP